MISCPFSSLTRKVALGSNSETMPGNSSSSSFAIRFLCRLPVPRHLGVSGPAGRMHLKERKSSHPHHLTRLKRKSADQREEPPSSQEVDCDLALEAFAQKLSSVVMHAAAPHIDGFESGRRLVQRGIVGFAEREIILEQAPERREREQNA